MCLPGPAVPYFSSSGGIVSIDGRVVSRIALRSPSFTHRLRIHMVGRQTGNKRKHRLPGGWNGWLFACLGVGLVAARELWWTYRVPE